MEMEAEPSLVSRKDVTELFAFQRKPAPPVKSPRFRVIRKGNWFIFDGTVDSSRAKTRLFSSVPKIDGAQWIVDRLRIDGAA